MSAARAAQPAGAPKKNPLRVAKLPRQAGIPQDFTSFTATPARRSGRNVVTAAELREMSVSEFAAWLRTQTSRKTKRPYQEQTVTAYCDAAWALHRWMTAQKIDADFTACDTAMLNRFFADYRAAHTQGGTNTQQRNLSHLFRWLEAVHGLPTPYAASLNRYAPNEARPSTLGEEFIRDMLAVTGGGRARSFVDVRDHAIIRVFTEGARLTELSQIQVSDLSHDLIAQPFIRVIPLKGARASNRGRLIPLSPATARAVVTYLRARQSHRHADSPALWLGTRNRGPLRSSGIYQMIKRRAIQAGYDPDIHVHPHQFRHTFVHDWLDGGGDEGNLMRLMGWKDRSMLDRYAEDMQVQRAIDAKLRRGDLY